MSDTVTPGGHGVRCMVMRGGTSKGLYFLADDLPADDEARADLLLSVMGSPDARQIDGMGGAHPLTSKVAVVGPSSTADADVDYLFLQVVVDQPIVTDQQNCGNILAGVGAVRDRAGPRADAADARGAGADPHGQHRWRRASATFPLRDGGPSYDGDTVDRRCARHRGADPARLRGHRRGRRAARSCPTGNAVDVIEGVDVTLSTTGCRSS